MESLYNQFRGGNLSQHTHPEAYTQFQPEAEAEYKKNSSIQQDAYMEYLKKVRNQGITGFFKKSTDNPIEDQTLKF